MDNIQVLLENIQKAIKSERDAQAYYEILIQMAPAKDKDIIRGIKEDEEKHERMFTDMYYSISWRMPVKTEPEAQKPRDYKSGLEKAIFDEVGAVEFYRTILVSTANFYIRDNMYIIITDEQEHAVKFTMLYSRA